MFFFWRLALIQPETSPSSNRRYCQRNRADQLLGGKGRGICSVGDTSRSRQVQRVRADRRRGRQHGLLLAAGADHQLRAQRPAHRVLGRKRRPRLRAALFHVSQVRAAAVCGRCR